jgi:hypothetical protein
MYEVTYPVEPFFDLSRFPRCIEAAASSLGVPLPVDSGRSRTPLESGEFTWGPLKVECLLHRPPSRVGVNWSGDGSQVRVDGWPGGVTLGALGDKLLVFGPTEHDVLAVASAWHAGASALGAACRRVTAPAAFRFLTERFPARITPLTASALLPSRAEPSEPSFRETNRRGHALCLTDWDDWCVAVGVDGEVRANVAWWYDGGNDNAFQEVVLAAPRAGRGDARLIAFLSAWAGAVDDVLAKVPRGVTAKDKLPQELTCPDVLNELMTEDENEMRRQIRRALRRKLKL